MNNEQRERMQLRADAITFLRTANLEGVSTSKLRLTVHDLKEHGAFVVPPAPKAPA